MHKQWEEKEEQRQQVRNCRWGRGWQAGREIGVHNSWQRCCWWSCCLMPHASCGSCGALGVQQLHAACNYPAEHLHCKCRSRRRRRCLCLCSRMMPIAANGRKRRSVRRVGRLSHTHTHSFALSNVQLLLYFNLIETFLAAARRQPIEVSAVAAIDLPAPATTSISTSTSTSIPIAIPIAIAIALCDLRFAISDFVSMLRRFSLLACRLSH